MAVSNVESAVIRLGDGIAVDFDFALEAVSAASIKVGYIVGGTVVEAAPATYSVVMNGALTGGVVTFTVAPVAATKIYIYRETDQTQIVSVSRQQAYNPAVVERVWDKLTLLIQELSTAVKRSVKTRPDADPDQLVNDLETARQEALAAAAAASASAAAAAATEAGAAAAISFAPTTLLPQTNMQAAIEAAGELAVSGFAAFGLGITGNAALLADLDATGTGAGIYRFDGTTTGTFPMGVAAGDTGMVELWRQAGDTAMMELHHAASNRVFRRRLNASVWGAWRDTVSVSQGAEQGDIVYLGASDWVRLPKGAARQALVMNVGATAPEWGGAGLGSGQTWQDVTGSRAFATSYQNTSGMPIVFDPRATTSGASHISLETSPDNSTWTVVRKVNHNIGSTFTDSSMGHVIVPNNFYYRCRSVSGTNTLTAWMELRA